MSELRPDILPRTSSGNSINHYPRLVRNVASQGVLCHTRGNAWRSHCSSHSCLDRVFSFDRFSRSHCSSHRSLLSSPVDCATTVSTTDTSSETEQTFEYKILNGWMAVYYDEPTGNWTMGTSPAFLISARDEPYTLDFSPESPLCTETLTVETSASVACPHETCSVSLSRVTLL